MCIKIIPLPFFLLKILRCDSLSIRYGSVILCSHTVDNKLDKCFLASNAYFLTSFLLLLTVKKIGRVKLSYYIGIYIYIYICSFISLWSGLYFYIDI